MSIMTLLPTCLDPTCEREVGPHHAFCVQCKAKKLDRALDLRLDAEQIEPDALADCDSVIRQVATNRRSDWINVHPVNPTT